MRFETLDAWLAWLELRHPKEIDLGLDRIRQVAARLELLNPRARVLTVAGTNGKGSCVAASAYLLRRSGLSVGVYTSPHFLHYCERICIDGVPATETEVCQSFATIDAASSDISLTYFEFGTLAALDIFRRRGVDIMVLEVGLGGRLDAVNLLDPEVAVVTSIALDHQDWLGSDRDSIGREKAGIFRSHRPAVCADPEPPEGLLAVARQLGTPLWQIERDFGFSPRGDVWRCWARALDGSELEYTDLPASSLPLPSLAAALQACCLLGLELKRDWLEGLCQLSLPGRFQRLECHGRELILDVAHNPAATAYLARRLAARPAAGKTHAVLAMMADKDRRGSLEALQAEIDHWWLADLRSVARAASLEQLNADLAALGLEAAGCGTVATLIERLMAETSEGDRIVIMGSFYTVAAALQWLAAQSDPGGEQ